MMQSLCGTFRAIGSSRSAQPEQGLIPPTSVVKRTVNVKVTRALGITQICLGVLTSIYGCVIIAILHHWAGSVGLGIASGTWFILSGVLGVCSASKSASRNLNTANLVIAVVSSVISGVGFVLCSMAVVEYKHSCLSELGHMGTDYRCVKPADSDSGLVLYSLLLMAMFVEGGVSVSVAVYCVKSTSYGSNNKVRQPMQRSAMPLPCSVSYHARQVLSYGMLPLFNSYSTAGVAYSSQPPGQQQNQIAPTTTTCCSQTANPATAVTYDQEVALPEYAETEAPPPYSYINTFDS